MKIVCILFLIAFWTDISLCSEQNSKSMCVNYVQFPLTSDTIMLEKIRKNARFLRQASNPSNQRETTLNAVLCKVYEQVGVRWRICRRRRHYGYAFNKNKAHSTPFLAVVFEQYRMIHNILEEIKSRNHVTQINNAIPPKVERLQNEIERFMKNINYGFARRVRYTSSSAQIDECLHDVTSHAEKLSLMLKRTRCRMMEAEQTCKYYLRRCQCSASMFL